MNTTASSYALALCFAALMATGCGKDEAQPQPAPSPAEKPIASEGFETGEPELDANDTSEDADGDA